MDPLSLTASIIAVSQLTTEAIKYLIDVQDAPKECQSCTTELLNLLPPLISLKDQAQRAEQAQSNDVWFEQLKRLNNRHGPLDQCKQALELLLSKVDVGEGLRKIKKRLLWRALSQAIKAETSFIQASLFHVQVDVGTLQTTVCSVKDDTEKIRDIQTREQYQTVLEWLSCTDYSAQQQDILSRREEGTAQWFLDSAEFRRWMQGPEKTLFCPGIPGAGKTMMAAVTIDYLSRTYTDKDVGIACVFCTYDAQADQSASGLTAAILKQLVLNNSETMTILTGLYDKHSKRGSRPAIDELLKLTLTCVSRSITYIIIDALDECTGRGGARDQLIGILFSLQAKTNLRLLFTSRSVPEVTDRFRSHPQLEVRASEEDVRRFIESQILRFPGFVQRDEVLQRDVKNGIAKSVDGMFLLARLHLDSVCAQTSPKKVRATLAQLRKGSDALDDAYKNALTRIDRQPPEHRDLAQRALCWISYAERQLTAQELRIALAIEPGESTLDIDNLNDLDDIVSFCAGLVTVDQESSVIRLVHYTTQEYLQRVRLAWAPDIQHKIAEACLTYICFDEFRSGSCISDAAFDERLVQHQFFDYSARFWSSHVHPVEQFFVKKVQQVLYEEDLLESITQVIFVASGYQFPGYSRCFPGGFTALHLTAYSGLHVLLEEILIYEATNSKNNVNKMDSDKGTPLYYASRNGHVQVVKLLLDKGAEVNARGGDYDSALCAASAGGHEKVIQLLLDKGADINAQGGEYGHALQAASACGHEQVVKLLLDKGADVNAQGGDFGNALQAALACGQKQVMKLLLSRGALRSRSGIVL